MNPRTSKTRQVFSVIAATLIGVTSVAAVFALIPVVKKEAALVFISPSAQNSQLAAVSGAGSGLVAHYTFDDGTAADASGNGNNGTVSGATQTAGKVGTGALQFDGVDDYIGITSPGALAFNSNYTVSFWISPAATFSGTIIRLSNSISNSIQRDKYEIRVTKTAVQFITGDGVTGDSDTFAATIPSGVWSFVTCTLSSSNVKSCFINGQSIGTATNNVDTSLVSAGVGRIGTNRDSEGNNFYEGALDDLRVYSRALSLEEIVQVYAEGGGTISVTPPVVTPPVVEPPVNEIPPPTEPITPATPEGTASELSQYGITWKFDKPSTYGQFANGDYWVLGPVQVTDITPAVEAKRITDTVGGICTGGSRGVNACSAWCTAQAPATYSSMCTGAVRGTGTCACDRVRNGWEVNPVFAGGQAFDNRSGSTDSTRIPPLPYTAKPGESLVKAISRNPASLDCDADDRNNGSCLKTASVLTVVPAVPPSRGMTVFRPPYVGTSKPLYSTNSIRTDLLPKYNLIPTAQTGNLAWVVKRFGKVQLDHKGGETGRFIHPIDHMPDYGGETGRDNADGALRLMFNEPIEQKMPALIAYLQFGIDQYHAILNGQVWPSGGGHTPGQRIPLAFTSILLDDAAMKEKSRTATFFHEDTTLVWGKGNKALYGNVESGESQYWVGVTTAGGSGNRSYKDPYGYIDGGPAPGTFYQMCCTSQPWKGEVLALHLMPILKTVWTDTKIIEYVNRWVTFGISSQPDPCAPLSQGGGPLLTSTGGYQNKCILDPDLNPESPLVKGTGEGFSCQPGKLCGRFPELHGTKADTGGHGSSLVKEMWKTYANVAAVPTNPPVVPTDTISPSLVSISVAAVTKTSALISWTTNEPATTQVQYGLTTAYGSQTTLIPAPVSSHTVTLSSLTPNTLYHYRVISKDAAGNTATSGDGTFSTLSLNSATQAPVVNIPPANVTPRTNVIPSSSDTSSAEPVEYPDIPAVNPPTSFTFTRHLTVGSTGTDVKVLQQYLNTNGYQIALTGAGSPGRETTYYGPATTRAIQKFQCAVLRICAGSPTTNGYGNFGPATRAALNARLRAGSSAGGSVITPPVNSLPLVTGTTTPYTFTRNLKVGMTGTDVKALQQFLNAQGFQVSLTGAGSPGNETSYYGPATARAVTRFQEAYRAEILSPSNLTRGTGYFGPSTRAKVNAMR